MPNILAIQIAFRPIRFAGDIYSIILIFVNIIAENNIRGQIARAKVYSSGKSI